MAESWYINKGAIKGKMGQKIKRQPGFTLVELMLVVAIIAILASVAVPKFADLVGKAQDAATKGKLGTIRSALTIYSSGNGGEHPAYLQAIVPDYLGAIPKFKLRPHAESNDVQSTSDLSDSPDVSFSSESDPPTWLYLAGNEKKLRYGDVWIACRHKDTVGISYSTY
jgi:prepilin-type N-terminal cleavage/methylation domain-containing protein